MKQLYALILAFSSILFNIQEGFAQPGNTCATAIPLEVNVNECSLTTVSNVGLSNSGQTPTGCPGYAGGDLWLSVVVPPSGELTVTAQLNFTTPNFLMDINMAVWSGTCGSLTIVDCDQDSGPGFYPAVTINATPGTTMYLQFWDIGNNQADDFDVCANGTPTCVSPSATFTRTCGETNEYNVEVNLTSLGDASAVNILNNGGAADVLGLTSTGVQVIGPFALGQAVQITVEHAEDETCNLVRNFTDVGLACNRIISCGTPLNQTYCYRNNDNTAFLYSSSVGSEITLTFNSGLIQNGADIITIRNGDNAGAPILFSGSNGGNLAGISVTASSGSIWLQVTSDVGGSCNEGSLGLGGGWNWDVSCEGIPACDAAVQLTSQTTLEASQITADLADFSYSGTAQCAGPGLNADPYFKFTAVASVTYISARGAGDLDVAIEVFDACGGSQLACVNDQGPGGTELFWLTDLTVGEEYVYRVHHAGSAPPTQTFFSTGIYHIPFVQLRQDFCNVTNLSAGSIIRSTTANPSTLLQNYIWEFTELEAPFQTYEVVSPNGTNPQFRMFWFTQFEYGRSYSVRIRVRMYEGANLGDYGPACTIGFIDEPVSALQPQFNNGTFQLCNVVKAVNIPGTTNYRWTFDDGENVLEYNSNSSNYFLTLINVPGIEYNKSYNVNVFVTGGGIESSTSIDRTLNTFSTVPATALNPAFIPCGSTVGITAWTQAFNVCGASSYTFRFTNTAGTQDPILAVRPNRTIVFSSVPGLQQGQTYNVAVYATVGSQEGSFGSECQITFATPPVAGLISGGNSTDLGEASIQTSVYPNPTAGGEVFINISGLSDVHGQVIVEVYDLSGKRLAEYNLASPGSDLTTNLPLARSLASGIYIVQTRVDGAVRDTQKLVVQ